MNSEQQITLKELIVKLLSFKWFILGITILTGIMGFVFGHLKSSTVFEANLEAVVIAKDGTGEENPIQYIYLADLALMDFKSMLESNLFIQKINTNSNTAGTSGTVSVDFKTSSRVAHVKVISESESDAAKIVSYIKQNVKADIMNMTAIRDLTIREIDNVKEMKTGSPLKFAAVGLIAGFIGMIILRILYIAIYRIVKES